MIIVVHECSMRKAQLQEIKDSHQLTVQSLKKLALGSGIWIHAKDGSIRKTMYPFDAIIFENHTLAEENH